MRNSISSISDVFGGVNPIVDLEDNSSDLVVMQRSDMTIAYTAKIASRFKALNTYWIERTIGYNVSDEVVYIQTNKPTVSTPTFVPEEVL